jgi:hypothetical protein
VVLLGYTNVFTRTHQWQDQAQYVMGEGEVCGFRQVATGFEGQVQFVLYHARGIPPTTRDLFRALFERFLTRRRVQVVRYPPVICRNAKCRYHQGREEVIRKVQEKKTAMFCSECGRKISLAGVGEIIAAGRGGVERIEKEQATAELRTRYESALVAIKSLARTRRKKRPTCFISYAWGVREHEQWVEKRLATDLRNAGVVEAQFLLEITMAHDLSPFDLAACSRQRGQERGVMFPHVPGQVVIIERRHEDHRMPVAEDEHVLFARLMEHFVPRGVVRPDHSLHGGASKTPRQRSAARRDRGFRSNLRSSSSRLMVFCPRLFSMSSQNSGLLPRRICSSSSPSTPTINAMGWPLRVRITRSCCASSTQRSSVTSSIGTIFIGFPRSS